MQVVTKMMNNRLIDPLKYNYIYIYSYKNETRGVDIYYMISFCFVLYDA